MNGHSTCIKISFSSLGERFYWYMQLRESLEELECSCFLRVQSLCCQLVSEMQLSKLWNGFIEKTEIWKMIIFLRWSNWHKKLMKTSKKEFLNQKEGLSILLFSKILQFIKTLILALQYLSQCGIKQCLYSNRRICGIF